MPVNDYFDLHKHKYLILNNIYKIYLIDKQINL